MLSRAVPEVGVLNTYMIQEDMLHLVYNCRKHKFQNETAIIFDDDEYEDFLKHYGMHLKIMQACMDKPEFADTLNKMLIVWELGR